MDILFQKMHVLFYRSLEKCCSRKSVVVILCTLELNWHFKYLTSKNRLPFITQIIYKFKKYISASPATAKVAHRHWGALQQWVNDIP